MNLTDWAVIGAGLLGLAVGARLLWRAAMLDFEIVIHRRRAELRQGRAPAGFVAACSDVARMYGVESGRIRGLRGPRLAFSRDIPERARQPFRNVWNPPPPRGGGGGGRRRAAG